LLLLIIGIVVFIFIRRRRNGINQKHWSIKDPKPNTTELLGNQIVEADGRELPIAEAMMRQAQSRDSNAAELPDTQVLDSRGNEVPLSEGQSRGLATGPVPSRYERGTESAASPTSAGISASTPSQWRHAGIGQTLHATRTNGSSAFSSQDTAILGSSSSGVDKSSTNTTLGAGASSAQFSSTHGTDSELLRMQREMDQLRERKLRLKELETLESREKELQSAIEERQKLSRPQ
jgi:hypothetical protein